MLRDCLQALADQFATYRDTGLVLEPAAVAAFEAILIGAIEQAQMLEEAADRHFAGHGLPADVVKIATMLARSGVSAGMPCNNGGAL